MAVHSFSRCNPAHLSGVPHTLTLTEPEPALTRREVLVNSPATKQTAHCRAQAREELEG